MQKSVLFTLLAVLSLLLIGVKSVRLFHRHAKSQAHIAVIYPENGVRYGREMPQRQIRHPVAEPEVVSSGREIEQAIRRRLDADAAANNAAGDFSAAADFESRMENRRIAGLYTEMNPADAARIIETLETGQAIRLLQMMNTESAAAILSRMKLDRARLITEQMLEETPNKI